MPLPTKKLNRRSSQKAIDDAISACIETMHHEHPDMDDDSITAACYDDARRHAGASKVPKK